MGLYAEELDCVTLWMLDRYVRSCLKPKEHKMAQQDMMLDAMQLATATGAAAGGSSAVSSDRTASSECQAAATEVASSGRALYHPRRCIQCYQVLAK